MRATPNNFFTGKRLAAALFAAALSLPLLCATTRAQEPDEPQTQQDAPPRQQPGRAPNLMQRLNLTREQRVQLREIRSQSEPELRTLTRRLRLARRALDEAIYADAVDDALVEQRSRELTEAQSALARLRAATELKVRRVLTDEQLRLFRNLRRQAQRRLMLQRRLNRNAAPAEAAPPLAPDPDAPANPPAARRRRP